jgi:hypothetical protein
MTPLLPIMFITAAVPEWTRKKQDEGPVAGDFKTEEQPVENLNPLWSSF